MVRLGPTAICRELGARYPVFGFSHSPDVIVALAQAGGFGVLGLAREMPDDIAPIIAEVEKRLAGKPYGIDLMLPAGVPEHADIGSVRAGLPPEHVAFVTGLRERFGLAAPTRPSFFTTQVRSEALFNAQIEAVLASKARAVATAIGIRPELIARAKAAGKYTISLVGSPRHAQKALALGVDALVAQGADAGGHTGPIGTFSLVPQIVAAAAGRPVLAAGGIGTGAQVAASLAMGAQGAWLGTLWLAAKENHTPPALLQRLIEASSDDTLVTRAHSGKPCRVVRSAWIDAWQASGAPAPLPMPQQQALTGGDFSAMHEYDRADLIYEAAGQSVFAIDAPTTVAAQMATLIADANAALATLAAAMAD
ncbi:nitronate monooxygenase [Paraburkholderia sp. JHI869]|uniref:NAD(P)H-dependent flavin oxidoreductase n=1 Tax=Paraburkholderia sp. JHI869 TaxID=3112959 RepID=UPI00316F7EA7